MTKMHLRAPLLLAMVSCLGLTDAKAWNGSAFKVCADPNNLPYSDRKGQGFENKIAELLAKEAGKKLEYEWFPQRMGFIRNTLKAQTPETDEYKCDVIMGLPTGAEQVATSKPYYRSTYAFVYAKNRGWDDLKSADDLDRLPASRKAKLKMAMFDGSPATTWLLNHKLIEYSIPFQSMDADASISTAQRLERDMLAGKIDMAIVWGPMAGYLQYHNKPGSFEVMPMKSEGNARFEFPMSMGVRIPDKERKKELDVLIESNAKEIAVILKQYRVPVVEGE